MLRLQHFACDPMLAVVAQAAEVGPMRGDPLRELERVHARADLREEVALVVRQTRRRMGPQEEVSPNSDLRHEQRRLCFRVGVLEEPKHKAPVTAQDVRSTLHTILTSHAKASAPRAPSLTCARPGHGSEVDVAASNAHVRNEHVSVVCDQ